MFPVFAVLVLMGVLLVLSLLLVPCFAFSESSRLFGPPGSKDFFLARVARLFAVEEKGEAMTGFATGESRIQEE